MSINEPIRHNWMDLLRGTAILLVVYLHGAHSVVAKYSSTWPGFDSIGESLTPFRMPVLMFLSGLLVAPSIAKGAKRYFQGKVQNILYPFILWTILMFGLYEFREAALGKEGRDLLASLLYQPIDHLWFLYYLMIYYVFAFFALVRWPTIGLSIAICTYAAAWWFDHSLLRLAFYFVFFVAGGWLGRHLPLMIESIQRYHWSTAVLSLFAGGIYFALHTEAFNTVAAYAPLFLAASMAVVFGLLKVSIWWPWKTIAAPIEWIGRHSLPVYLVHWPVTLVAPVILVKIYDGNPNLLMPFYLLGILGISIMAAWLAARSRLASLFFSAKWNNGNRHQPEVTSESIPR